MANLSNPAAIAQKQVQAALGATKAYTDGVNGVTVAPGQLAAQAGQKWLNAVTQSLARYQARVGAVSLQQWQQLAVTKGAQRLGQGVQAAQQKIVNFWQNFGPKLAAIQANVRGMPSDSYQARIQRMLANADQIHALKGQLT